MMRMSGAGPMMMVMMAGMFSRERGLREDRNGKRSKQEAHHDLHAVLPSGAHLHRTMRQNRAVLIFLCGVSEPGTGIAHGPPRARELIGLRSQFLDQPARLDVSRNSRPNNPGPAPRS